MRFGQPVPYEFRIEHAYVSVREAIVAGLLAPSGGTVEDMCCFQPGRDAPLLFIPIVMRFVRSEVVLIAENSKTASYMP
jgi:hypothetical protein